MEASFRLANQQQCLRQITYLSSQLRAAESRYNSLAVISSLPIELFVCIILYATVPQIPAECTRHSNHRCSDTCEVRCPLKPRTADKRCRFSPTSSTSYMLGQLRLVCKAWSTTIMTTPTLWSTIDLRYPETVPSMLHNSRQANITVLYNATKNNSCTSRPLYRRNVDISRRLLQDLASRSDRIIDIDITAEASATKAFFKDLLSISPTFPQLKYISTCSSGNLSPTFNQWMYPPVEGNQTPPIDCPRLRSLTLDLWMDAIFISSSPTLRSLRDIQLIVSTVGGSTEGSNVVNSIACASTCVETIFIRGRNVTDSIQPTPSFLRFSPLPLPRLRSINFSGVSGQLASTCLEGISSPSAQCSVHFDRVNELATFADSHPLPIETSYRLSASRFDLTSISLFPTDPLRARYESSVTKPVLSAISVMEPHMPILTSLLKITPALSKLTITCLEVTPYTEDPSSFYPNGEVISPAGWVQILNALPFLTSIILRDMRGTENGGGGIFLALSGEQALDGACPCPSLKDIRIVYHQYAYRDASRSAIFTLDWIASLLAPRSVVGGRSLFEYEVTLDFSLSAGLIPENLRCATSTRNCTLDKALRDLRQVVPTAIAICHDYLNEGYGWR